MTELKPFYVRATTDIRQEDIDVLVTPSEETKLEDLKQGDVDPVIKWSFAWSYDKRNYVTRYLFSSFSSCLILRLGYNKIENKILAMNDPNHQETVFLETALFGAMAGEVRNTVH